MNALVPEPLPPEEAYDLWAADYDRENAVSTLERLAVEELTPPLNGKKLLDVGCGTGRRLAATAAQKPAWTGGVDVVRSMLVHGRRRYGTALRLVNGDLANLPLMTGSVDVLWCRLALGHVHQLEAAYQEMGRVARHGAALIVTDFHPAAAQAGHRRTFRDAAGELRAVAFQSHAVDAHATAAGTAGFSVDRLREIPVGPDVRRFYEMANSMARYRREVGLPLVFAYRYVRR